MYRYVDQLVDIFTGPCIGKPNGKLRHSSWVWGLRGSTFLEFKSGGEGVILWNGVWGRGREALTFLTIGNAG